MTAPDVDLQPRATMDTKPTRCRARSRFAGSFGMAFWQLLLGIAVLLAWQGASGRLVDNFFISNPIDVAVRLWGWISDGSIFRHVWATVYATTLGFFIGAVGGADPRHLARPVAVRQPSA